MLKIRFSDNSQPAFWVMHTNFSIGRAKSNHLSIDDDSVDDKHASISLRDDIFILKDLDSKSGTYVNDTPITKKNIGCGDTIRIGNVCIDIIDPFLEEEGYSKWALIADSSWLNGQEFPLTFADDKQSVTLGRSNTCDIVIPGTHLSREHAEIKSIESGLQIRDLNSANGTFVNDKQVSASRLKAGDRIRLDVYSFRVFGPGMDMPRAATRSMPAINMDDTAEIDVPPKNWKTGPTSPGNRTEENLYSKRWLPALIGSVMLAAFAFVLVYLLVL